MRFVIPRYRSRYPYDRITFKCNRLRYQPSETTSLSRALKETVKDGIIYMEQITYIFLKRTKIKMKWGQDVLKSYTTQTARAKFLWKYCKDQMRILRKYRQSERSDLYERISD